MGRADGRNQFCDLKTFVGWFEVSVRPAVPGTVRVTFKPSVNPSAYFAFATEFAFSRVAFRDSGHMNVEVLAIETGLQLLVL